MRQLVIKVLNDNLNCNFSPLCPYSGDLLRAVRPGKQISNLVTVQTGTGAHPFSCPMSTGSFPGVQPEAVFEGGKWGDRPRPRASGLRSSLRVCQAIFSGKLKMLIYAPFKKKILLQGQIT